MREVRCDHFHLPAVGEGGSPALGLWGWPHPTGGTGQMSLMAIYWSHTLTAWGKRTLSPSGPCGGFTQNQGELGGAAGGRLCRNEAGEGPGSCSRMGTASCNNPEGWQGTEACSTGIRGHRAWSLGQGGLFGSYKEAEWGGNLWLGRVRPSGFYQLSTQNTGS